VQQAKAASREMERRQMDLRAMIGGVSGVLGVICAVIGIFVLEGVSIELPGILLGGLGYYLGLTSQDRVSQILGIIAVVLNVISLVISGLSAPPQ
jgi:small-conductance mechanosensitive channel